MLNLQATPEGILLSVRATPGAKKNAIQGIHDGMLKVSVTAAPEDGKANAAIVVLLAKKLNISKSRVQLVMGATQRQKKFLLIDVEAAAAEQLIPM